MTCRSCMCCPVNFCYVRIGLAWFSVTFRFGRALRSVVVWCCLHDGLCSCACCPAVAFSWVLVVRCVLLLCRLRCVRKIGVYMYRYVRMRM